MYAAAPAEPFPIQAVDINGLDAKYYRRLVDHDTSE